MDENEQNTQQSDGKDYRGEHLVGLSCQFTQYISLSEQWEWQAICRHLQFQFPIQGHISILQIISWSWRKTGIHAGIY